VQPLIHLKAFAKNLCEWNRERLPISQFAVIVAAEQLYQRPGGARVTKETVYVRAQPGNPVFGGRFQLA
jgi:hypothetical protein